MKLAAENAHKQVATAQVPTSTGTEGGMFSEMAQVFKVSIQCVVFMHVVTPEVIRLPLKDE